MSTKRLLQWWRWQFSLSNGGVYYQRYGTALSSVEKTVKIPIFQFLLTNSHNMWIKAAAVVSQALEHTGEALLRLVSTVS